VTQGNLDARPSVQSAFQGAYGVFSVQNPMVSSLEAEVKQGKLVADLAKEANIQHLIYGATGIANPPELDHGIQNSKWQRI
jgi:uncharacterized protein YbjT (DUF2867 family)